MEISNGRQYTLEECSNYTMDAHLQEIQKASHRAKDIPYHEMDRIEFETGEVARGILDLQATRSWEVALDGVQTAEEMDKENFIKTL